jgi:hypothetical protein
MENTTLTYNEFLAFVMVYGAQINLNLSAEELAFIKTKTGINNIDSIKQKVDDVNDIGAIEIIDTHRKIYLTTPEKEAKMRKDLEEMLQSSGEHSQLESVAVHILEKLI